MDEANREAFEYAKDSNCYEMINLFLFGAKYSSEYKDVNIDILTKILDLKILKDAILAKIILSILCTK